MGHVAHMGDIRKQYKVLVGRPEKHRFRWGNNMKIYLKGVGWE
jgi:hypothetical protein